MIETEHSPEWLGSQFADWKERATELYRELAQLAAVAVAADDVGTGASTTVMSKRDIETWGAVGNLWGADIDAAIELESPLSVKWWAAILDCPSPDEALAVAMHDQLGSTQIRQRFGVVRHKQPDPPAYKGTARVDSCWGGMAKFRLNLAEEPPKLAVGDNVILTVRRRK